MVLEEVLPGDEVATAYGPCYRTLDRWPADEPYGGQPLREFATVQPSNLAFLTGDDTLNALDPIQTLFLDTETTGLGDDPGTVAFMVGLGYLADEHFVIEQYFMRSYDEERAMLAAVADRLAQFSSVVTFNGKAFDLPLLHRRCRQHRLHQAAARLAGWRHLDLLGVARRLWRRVLPSRALTALETAVLDVRRPADDVPGWLIPSLYTDFIQSRNARSLRPVFVHNQYDVLTMVALAVHMSWLVERPVAVRPGSASTAGALAAIALCFEARGDLDGAARSYARALQGNLPPQVHTRLSWDLSLLHKRRQDWGAAVAAWEQMLSARSELRLPALVELAKYYEHRRRDLARASTCAVAARQAWQARPVGLGASLLASVETGGPPLAAALDRRVQRLAARIASERPRPHPAANGD